MRRITSALFLDFDNLFSGLLKADRSAADAFIKQPALLIDRLGALDAQHGASRDVLVRRAYLNPAGTIPHPSGDPASERLPISRYRAPLTKAGYEVIDCPTLAKGKKNAADIRMVIDVLDALTGPVRYDEIIIGSSDADFTPLLVKLRANDRRTMILTTGTIAAPYGAMADRTVGETELIRLLTHALKLVEPVPAAPKTPAQPKQTAPAEATKAVKTAPPTPKAKTNTKTANETKAAKPATPPKLQPGTTEAHALATVKAVLAASAAPVSLRAVGSAVHQEVGGDAVRETKWFGHSTLTAFVRDRQSHLKVDTLRVWDPARHEPPAAASR